MKLLVKVAVTVTCALSLAAGLVGWNARGLPSVSELRRRHRALYAADGQSTWLALSAIPFNLQAAVLVAEDVDFYRHHGFNVTEMKKSLVENVRAGHYRRGGSTITQQVAKNLFLTPEKTLRRKLKEAILAQRLERALSKDEILEIYLNIAEWGEGVIGAEAASRHYFAKSATGLTWSEAALLAGILPNPRQFNPFHSCDDAMRVRQTVLLRLLTNGDVSSAEFDRAMAEPICGRSPTPGIASALQQ